ncbi:Methyltransferase type 11 [Acidimicrobium ferrooxidans DSM 10331]|uniref:Methyltransferase type 11 n=1 Tax=Acidimicrobium ferrooxidans (strain DSM 10331 / JCM 15462 / NBRC 103882 / ICP) TaxID=525909 RepID=C7M2J2_ACIFD|nr:class I SAM-dependent methyltransferase [Acidimicrobium ferrooxidans]ACU53236.1 Methyltransferase type 11 [Acidimicrobium ferrooxidans DSM 10331]
MSTPVEDLGTRQQAHWEATFRASPQLYGSAPSEAGRWALSRMLADGAARVLELGAGHGRDTLHFLDAGLEVTAVDYAVSGLAALWDAAHGRGTGARLTSVTHDLCRPLPLADGYFDACFAHMLFTMAFTTSELVALGAELHRVLRPGATCVYTVRHKGDAHYGQGIDLGDDRFENGGFAVHFFDEDLVHRLADGFELEDVTAFEEGDLPRRLWRVTMRRR